MSYVFDRSTKNVGEGEGVWPKSKLVFELLFWKLGRGLSQNEDQDSLIRSPQNGTVINQPQLKYYSFSWDGTHLSIIGALLLLQAKPKKVLIKGNSLSHPNFSKILCLASMNIFLLMSLRNISMSPLYL